MEKLNYDVGYYVNEEGYLQWNLTRLLPQEPADAQLPTAPAAPAPVVTASRAPLVPSNFGGRTAMCADQAQQLDALDGYRSNLSQLMAVHRAAQRMLEPVVPRPVHANPRGQSARKHNRDGW